MPLYKKALIVGATSGIGEALALKLAADGTEIVAVGRRQDRLDALAAKAPEKIVATVQQDITDLPSLPAFAAAVTSTHPDLDCVILNSGIQRALDFSKPASVDLTVVGVELTTNYLAHVHLTTAFLPHLQTLAKKGTPSYLLFVSSALGLLPISIRTPNYNATKAAMHAFVTVLRQQQQDAGFDQLRIIEVLPPAVQTELHDEKHQPDLVGGSALGMPLDDFTNSLYAQLQKDLKGSIAIGFAEPFLAPGGWEDQRQKAFETGQATIRALTAKFAK